jgi:uncharacterized protein (DUF305 family)
MQHARDLHVVDVATAPGEETWVFDPPHPVTDKPTRDRFPHGLSLARPPTACSRAKLDRMLTDERDGVDVPGPPAPTPPTERPGPARWQVVALVVALCFLAGVVGWWLNEPGDESFNAVDIGFLADMQTHHNGAIDLSFEYLDRSHDGVVKHFAQEILANQSQEQAVMNGYLSRAGGPSVVNDGVSMAWMGHPVAPTAMPGMPTSAERGELRAAEGLIADDVFTRLMIRHHAGGVAMADYAAEHGDHPGVRALASSMAKVQRVEINEMNNRRVALGLPAVPRAEIDALERVHQG